jgi:hypothetical protein
MSENSMTEQEATRLEAEHKAAVLSKIKAFLPDDVAEYSLEVASKLLGMRSIDSLASASFILNIVGTALLQKTEGKDVNNLPVEIRNLLYYNEMCHHMAMQTVAERDGRPIIEEIKKAHEAHQQEQEVAESIQPSIILQ